MKAVIMAGGRGTRLASLTKEIPKPMIQVCGKPILEHQIECLKAQGIKDIIITVGYLSDFIIDYFHDGKKFGVNIEYFKEDKPMGNAGALYCIKPDLGDDFLLINGDILFDIDIERFIRFHNNHDGEASLIGHPNAHPWDSALISCDKTGLVTRWLMKEDARPQYYQNLVNSGIHILSTKALTSGKESSFVDLDRDILRPLVNKKALYCYKSPEYIKDMGTPERYKQVCEDYSKGRVASKSLNCKQRAVFIDRDGTINKEVGFLNSIDDFELLEGADEAIKLLNENGYLAIVVTNQPVIARGELTVEELSLIHNKMETLLAQNGAFLDAIYYCPHHPDKGFAGEVQALKVQCSCRKPKPGMLLQAAEDYNISLQDSWMIGDSDRDVKAGINAGCMTALIGHEQVQQNISASSLYDAVKKILKLQEN